MTGILSESYITIGSKFYETLLEFEVLSPGLLIFWPAAWSLTLVAMRTKMSPEEYGRQLAVFLLQTLVGYNVGNMWEKFASSPLYSVPKAFKVKAKASGVREQAQRTLFVVLAFEVAVFSILIWPLNRQAFWNAMLSLTAISVISPLLRRVSFWTQAALSLAMNWFLVVAWVANYDIDWPVLTTLLLASLSWSSHYDLYRSGDKQSKTSPPSTRNLLIILGYSLACIASLAAVGLVTRQDYPFFFLSVLGGATQLAWQVAMTDRNDPSSRLSAFVSNGTCFGPIVWSGLLINYLNGIESLSGATEFI